MEKGPRFGITGKIVESEVFGSSKESKEPFGRGHEKYLPFKSAFLGVKQDQDNSENGCDPADPEADFANDLHASIAEELTPDDYEKLKFYTAIGTPLDKFHGIDGFFEFELENGETAVVTMDVTTNPNKLDYKADVILRIPDEGVDKIVDKEEYESVLREAVQDVHGMLKAKIEGRGQYAT